MAEDRLPYHLGKPRHGAENSDGNRLFFRLFLLIGALLLPGAPGTALARRWAVPSGPNQWRIVEDGKKNRRTAKDAQDLTSPSVTYSYTLNQITWNVTYLDPDGEGFNDAVKGTDRRATVFNVLNTISNTLHYTTGTLDVLFQISSSAAPDVLAYGGTSFPAGPDGFYNGMAFDHLSTGVDPSPTLPDINCTVNFSYPLYAGPGAPAGNEYDLQSILLHEFTHGMGILSLAFGDGTSRITNKNPGIFTVWDSMLQTTAGMSLWAEGGRFTGTPAVLTGNPPVVFGGALARLWNHDAGPRVYTPAKFVAGTSLSHWDDTFSGMVMEPSIDPGEVRRAYSPIDKAALRDIGWHVYAVTGVRDGWGLYE